MEINNSWFLLSFKAFALGKKILRKYFNTFNYFPYIKGLYSVDKKLLFQISTTEKDEIILTWYTWKTHLKLYLVPCLGLSYLLVFCNCRCAISICVFTAISQAYRWCREKTLKQGLLLIINPILHFETTMY